jgi:Uma2 family endonuclease
MLMLAKQQQFTLDDFLALPDDGNRHEFVRGELRTMPPPKGKHGIVEAAIIEAIGRYLYERALSQGWEPRQGLSAREALVGRTGSGELGLRFAVPDDPTMVRGADIAFIPAQQLARVSWDEHEYFPAVPALVIEVISETDRATAVAEKVQDYLAGGAQRVWCVYPDLRAIHVHAADAPLRIIRGDNAATDDLLPGFALPLNLIFT